jgi:signal transduction histidine kinase
VSEVLANAVHYTSAGGVITIQGRRARDTCELIVHDTGLGISPEQLSELAKPFSQLQRQEEIGGLGIGLALVRGIIEAHHGRITIESPGPGQGTTLTLSLPATASGA